MKAYRSHDNRIFHTELDWLPEAAVEGLAAGWHELEQLWHLESGPAVVTRELRGNFWHYRAKRGWASVDVRLPYCGHADLPKAKEVEPEPEMEWKWYNTAPPIGLRPYEIAREARFKEIHDAMERYSQANTPVPDDWVVELDFLKLAADVRKLKAFLTAAPLRVDANPAGREQDGLLGWSAIDVAKGSDLVTKAREVEASFRENGMLYLGGLALRDHTESVIDRLRKSNADLGERLQKANRHAADAESALRLEKGNRKVECIDLKRKISELEVEVKRLEDVPSVKVSFQADQEQIKDLSKALAAAEAKVEKAREEGRRDGSSFETYVRVRLEKALGMPRSVIPSWDDIVGKAEELAKLRADLEAANLKLKVDLIGAKAKHDLVLERAAEIERRYYDSLAEKDRELDRLRDVVRGLNSSKSAEAKP